MLHRGRRQHDVLDWRVEFSEEAQALPRGRDGRVHEQRAVAQAQHRHAGVDDHVKHALRLLEQPKAGACSEAARSSHGAGLDGQRRPVRVVGVLLVCGSCRATYRGAPARQRRPARRSGCGSQPHAASGPQLRRVTTRARTREQHRVAGAAPPGLGNYRTALPRRYADGGGRRRAAVLTSCFLFAAPATSGTTTDGRT